MKEADAVEGDKKESTFYPKNKLQPKRRRKMMNYINLLNSKQNGDYRRLGDPVENPGGGYQIVDCPNPISTPKLAKMFN